jgi:hypothetical protein
VLGTGVTSEGELFFFLGLRVGLVLAEDGGVFAGDNALGGVIELSFGSLYTDPVLSSRGPESLSNERFVTDVSFFSTV